MRVFLGMILGALLLVAGVYIYDSMSTSTVANGQVAQANRTIVNWDVAASDWDLLKRRAHRDWIKLSSMYPGQTFIFKVQRLRFLRGLCGYLPKLFQRRCAESGGEEIAGANSERALAKSEGAGL